MIHAYVLIEAEPTRVQELVVELADMELDGSVIKQVHATTGRFDLIDQLHKIRGRWISGFRRN